MASFTDQTPQFNPYIQQQPVELMLKVGMEKQRRYDEGVQKIQTSIDNVAGLDIANPAQQEYLQSKLNELGSKLKTVAGGDFSNYQLVNSVGGMATQLGNDKVVQNAVSSTARIRKGQQEQETARKAGKSHINNDNYWNNDVNKYISSTDIGATFNDQYYQYTDVTKKLNELGEKLHAEDKHTESAVQRYSDGSTKYFDAKGNLTTQDKGQSRPDDAILAITTKTKTAEKLLSTFYRNLDDNDRQQLKIDAWANYKGSTKETFIKDIKDNYDSGKKMLEANVIDLAVKLKGKNLSTSDRLKYETELNASADALKDGTLDKAMQSKVDQLNKLNDGNIDAYKTQLYTEKHLSGLAQSLAYQDVKQEIKNNPYAQMALERQKFQFQINRARVEDYNSNRNYNLEVAKHEYTKYKDQKDKSGSDYVVTGGGLRTDLPMPTINDLRGREDNVNTALIDLQNKYIPAIVFENDKLSPQAKVAVMNDLYKKYLINPNSINLTDNNLRKYFNQRRGLEIEQAQIGQLRKKTNDIGLVFDDKVTARLKSYPGVVVNGTRFSAKDLYDVAANSNNFLIGGKASSVSGGQVKGTFFDKANFLKQYAGTPKQRVAEIIAKSMSGGRLTDAEKKLTTHVRALQADNSNFVSSIYRDKFNAQSEYLAEKMPEYQTKDASLDVTNDVDMAHANVLISDAINKYNERGALDVNRKEDFNPDVLNGWRSDPKVKLDYIIKKNYDGSATFIVQNGKQQQKIPVPAVELGQRFPNAGKRSSFDDIENAISVSPYHTTNLIGARDPVNAYLTGEDLPQLKGTAVAHRVRLDVEGSGVETKGQPNKDYQLVMYAQRSDGTWTEPIILNNKGFAGQAGISGMLGLINTSTVDQVLNK